MILIKSLKAIKEKRFLKSLVNYLRPYFFGFFIFFSRNPLSEKKILISCLKNSNENEISEEKIVERIMNSYKKMSYDFESCKKIFKPSKMWIDHVDKGVKRFLSECIRVIKVRGVIRLAFPDAKFIYDISSFENEYWNKARSDSCWLGKDPSKLKSLDFLIGKISTNKFNRNNQEYDKIIKKIKNLDYLETMNFLTKDNKFDILKVGNHINYFDYYKLKKIFSDICLDLNIKNYIIINSKPKGSVSQLLSEECFSKNEQISSYVEFVKF